MSWGDLRAHGGPQFVVRPISTWPGAMPAEHRHDRFRTTPGQTMRSGRRPMLAIVGAALAVLCFAIAVSRGWV